MFDYQAGEKYKMTLIMVGLAGLMAGVFFTVLLMPTPEPQARRGRQAHSMQGDNVNARRSVGSYSAAPGAANAMAAQQAQQAEQAAQSAEPVQNADPAMARALVEQWLPLAWDLSAGTAKASQTRAMLALTPDCAAAYQKNVWTPDMAKQIDESGLKSSFSAGSISAGENLNDGSVVVYVNGVQTLSVPNKGSTSRQVSLEYMVKRTPDGLRIAGISEGGKGL